MAQLVAGAQQRLISTTDPLERATIQMRLTAMAGMSPSEVADYDHFAAHMPDEDADVALLILTARMRRAARYPAVGEFGYLKNAHVSAHPEHNYE
jgi:hypothetical protein